MGRKTYFILVFINFLSLTATDFCCQEIKLENQGDSENLEKSDIKETILPSSDERFPETSEKIRRYILYDVNPGEGFNLRRDIFIRIFPLIESLNDADKGSGIEWVLVLPPWQNLPHWGPTAKSFSWSTFFVVENISIPVIELHDWIDEYGGKNGIDVVYQLQHFPFIENEVWKEEIKTSATCVEPLKYQKKSNSKFKGKFWNQPLEAGNAECLSLRGQASTLLPFLKKLNKRAVMFDNAETILWNNYGNEEWWRARMSLRFARRLHIIANSFINTHKLRDVTSNSQSESLDDFIGVHLRRKDFVFAKSLPTLEDVKDQVIKLAANFNIRKAFLATDATKEEISTLQRLILDSDDSINKLEVITFPCSADLSPGECAIIEQIICISSKHFIGTEDSTFTFRIFEEREINQLSPSSTYNYLCASQRGKSCKKPTRWPIPKNLIPKNKA